MQSMALAYRGADAANSRSAPDSPPVFPRSSLAARTASIAPPPAEASTAAAAAPPPRQPFVSLPPALMMVPFGSSTAAIADVMDVTYEEAAGAITLQLDVVHQPVVFSQFVPHVGGRRHSDSDTTAAHYHFATRPGMTVDAAGLLTGLQESNYKPEGVWAAGSMHSCAHVCQGQAGRAAACVAAPVHFIHAHCLTAACYTESYREVMHLAHTTPVTVPQCRGQKMSARLAEQLLRRASTRHVIPPVSFRVRCVWCLLLCETCHAAARRVACVPEDRTSTAVHRNRVNVSSHRHPQCRGDPGGDGV